MKAREYYDKYEEGLWNGFNNDDQELFNKTVSDMSIEMVKETEDAIKRRNIQTDRAVIGLVHEMNERWNAIVNLFIKKHGESPIVRDGYKILITDVLPEIKGMI